MKCIKSTLKSQYKMVDAGPASWVLGICVTNDLQSGRITLNQSQYIQKVCQRFSMIDCKPTSSPLPEKQKQTCALPQMKSYMRHAPTLTSKS